jgi:hypothetical protein
MVDPERNAENGTAKSRAARDIHQRENISEHIQTKHRNTAQ